MKLTVVGTKVHVSRAAAVVIVLSLIALGYLAYDYHEQTTLIDEAEEVEATVVDVGIEEIDERRGTSYRPDVEYGYEYDGSRYTSDNVFPPGIFVRDYHSRQEASEITSLYEEGENTTAYVDPSNPETSFLRATPPRQPIWYGGLLMMLFSLTVLHVVGPRDVGRVELRPIENVERRRYQTLFGVDRDAVHTYSKRYGVLSAVAVFGFLLLFALVMAIAFVRNDFSSVHVDANPLGPFGLPLVAAFLAFLACILSVFVYSVWSFTEYRRIRDRIPEPKPPSPFKHPSCLVTITERSVRADETNEYEDRIKLTVLSVVAWLILTASVGRILTPFLGF